MGEGRREKVEERRENGEGRKKKGKERREKGEQREGDGALLSVGLPQTRDTMRRCA
jgi:hypothetical protein